MAPRGIPALAVVVLSACLTAPPEATDDARDGGGGGATDSATGDDAWPCRGDELLADDFPGQAIDTDLWRTDESTFQNLVSVDDGLRLDVAPTPEQGYLFAAVVSNASFPFEAVTLQAEIEFDVVGQGDSFMGWLSAEDEYVGFFIENYGSGNVIGAHRGALNGDRLKLCDPCTAYDDTLHRHVRVRGDGDLLHFEVSAGAGAWTAVAPPQPIVLPLSRHVFAWAECDIENEVHVLVERVAVHECDDA